MRKIENIIIFPIIVLCVMFTLETGAKNLYAKGDGAIRKHQSLYPIPGQATFPSCRQWRMDFQGGQETSEDFRKTNNTPVPKQHK